MQDPSKCFASPGRPWGILQFVYVVVQEGTEPSLGCLGQHSEASACNSMEYWGFSNLHFTLHTISCCWQILQPDIEPYHVSLDVTAWHAGACSVRLLGTAKVGQTDQGSVTWHTIDARRCWSQHQLQQPTALRCGCCCSLGAEGCHRMVLRQPTH